MKLKTLKDMKIYYFGDGIDTDEGYKEKIESGELFKYGTLEVKELRQAAIEWIHHLEKINKKESFEIYNFSQIVVINWIREFFNITGEDLK